MTLTDRELATVVLVGIVALIALVRVIVTRGKGKVAASAGQVVKSAFAPKIVVVFLGFLIWMAFAVAISWWLGWWDIGLLKDTFVITLGVGFPLVGVATTATTLGALGRKVIVGALGFGALASTYINLVSFPFVVELLLQPLAVFVVALWAFSARDKKHTPVRRSLSALVGVGVVAAIAWTTLRLVTTFGEHDWNSDIAVFLLGVGLPLLMLPYVYFVAIASRIEVILIRIDHRAPVPLRAKLALGIGTRFSLKWLARFNGTYPKQLGRAETLSAAFGVMREFRENVESEDVRLRDRDEHEAALVGIRGVDHAGAQVDRSEFEVTKGRLEWIWTCQVGRYVQNGNRYWDDLTDWMVSAERHGLTVAHGFITEVTSDGQQWRCWRKMPSGSVLGIGGANGEAKDYFYGGSNPPTSWPTDQPTQWTSIFEPRPPDWQHYDGPHR